MLLIPFEVTANSLRFLYVASTNNIDEEGGCGKPAIPQREPTHVSQATLAVEEARQQ